MLKLRKFWVAILLLVANLFVLKRKTDRSVQILPDKWVCGAASDRLAREDVIAKNPVGPIVAIMKMSVGEWGALAALRRLVIIRRKCAVELPIAAGKMILANAVLTGGQRMPPKERKNTPSSVGRILISVDRANQGILEMRRNGTALKIIAAKILKDVSIRVQLPVQDQAADVARDTVGIKGLVLVNHRLAVRRVLPGMVHIA